MSRPTLCAAHGSPVPMRWRRGKGAGDAQPIRATRLDLARRRPIYEAGGVLMWIDTRPAAVAGMFYPGDARTLARRCRPSARRCGAGRGWRARQRCSWCRTRATCTRDPSPRRLMRLLAPWRGHIRRVVLLGPTHRVAVRGLALPDVSAFATPLGRVELDPDALLATARAAARCESTLKRTRRSIRSRCSCRSCSARSARSRSCRWPWVRPAPRRWRRCSNACGAVTRRSSSSAPTCRTT